MDKINGQSRLGIVGRSAGTLGPGIGAIGIVAVTIGTLAGPGAVGGQAVPDDDVHARLRAETVEAGVDYRVYARDGAPTTLSSIVERSLADDVLLIGEEHADVVGHAVQERLLERLFDEAGAPEEGGRTLILSMEMFERDVQYVLDEYLADLISEKHFLDSARPWPRYAQRYRALLEMAKDRGAPVVAANAPRRYVNRVTTDGPASLHALPASAREHLPPLPYPGPSLAYRSQWDEIMAVGSDDDRGYAGDPDALYAQALWDASMGYAVTQALVRHLYGFVVHVSGSFHVARNTGIPEAIAHYRPGTRVTSVVLTRTDDVDAWAPEEHEDLADFVILTRRAESPHGGGR